VGQKVRAPESKKIKEDKTTMNNLQNVTKLFDFILSGNYMIEKKMRLAEQKMNHIFKMLECDGKEASPGVEGANEIPHVPDSDVSKEFEDVFDELAMEHKSVKSYIARSMARVMTEQENGDNSYQSFFRKKMEQWNVSSPGQLKDEDKGAFFTEVEKEWSTKK
jgi:hypothetical protein